MNLPTTRQLYPFQREWIDWAFQHGFGFCWDEPGLGKTTQAIVAMHNLDSKGPWLIVCPNSLKPWWKREISNLYPEDRDQILVAGIGGRFISPKFGRKVEIGPHLYHDRYGLPKWVITHYAGIRISEDSYAQVEWSGVCADEVHYCKNKTARRTQALYNITPKLAYRIGLTATPFGTNPADLWSQLHWMAPDQKGLNSYWRFFNLFVDYDWSDPAKTGGRKYRIIKGGKNLELLSKVMHHYGLQRTKQQVAPDLPPVTHTDMPIELNEREKRIYDALQDTDRVELVVANSDVEAVADGAAPFTATLIKNTLARLTKSEQWLSHPWTFDPGTRSSKLEWIKEWADSYPLPAVIATRFRASAERIRTELGERCARPIMGKVHPVVRQTIMDDWRAGKYQFLVGTIGTIGVGLNLQHAHQMICYDQVHSPIQMDQLYQRIHRIDSDHKVEVIYLFAEDTTNELILKSFREKWNQMQLVREYLKQLQEVTTK